MKYYLGLDVGGTNFAAGIIDENYRVIEKTSVPAGAGRSIEEITADMANVSLEVVKKAGLDISDFTSWGIGMPSYVNPRTNLLVHANCFGWKNAPIYSYLERHIPLPIYIENDANCAALGETLAGGAKGYENVLMLTLGTGLGGGIILNKKIYAGADMMGGRVRTHKACLQWCRVYMWTTWMCRGILLCYCLDQAGKGGVGERARIFDGWIV